jgi:nicotinamide mononucleotide transporter
LAYLVLAVRNHVSCFVIGFVSSLLWAYSSWELYNLKWDASLNLFYAIMSIYGFYAWTRGYDEVEERPITEHNLSRHGIYILIIIVCTLAMTWGGIEVLGTSFAFWDSLTTVLSVLGTFLLTYRIMSTWVYLLIADIIYIGIYWASGAYAFSVMMVIYSVMAIAGWLSWRKIRLQQV